MDTTVTRNVKTSLHLIKDPEIFTHMIETLRGAASLSPRMLRPDDARTILNKMLVELKLEQQHLERIALIARESSDHLWQEEADSTGPLAMEKRQLARIYDSILETAERQLQSCSD